MDSQLQQLFLTEIRHQCRFARMAYIDFFAALNNLQTDQVWYSLQSFLTAAANISKIFWPIKRAPYKERGEFLRNLLNVDQSAPFRIRDPRNHFEHFDERLDDWFLQSTHHNIIDTSIGGDNIINGPIDFMRFFNNERFVFRFRGDEYPINPIRDALEALVAKVEVELDKPILP